MEEQNETPQKVKTKDKSRIKQVSFWAGMFRNFFTIIASIVSVVTLFILIRQNENTYRPDLELSVATPTFEISYNDNPLSCNDIQLRQSADSSLQALSIHLVNLGMGAAKNVELHWQAAPEKMSDTVSLGSHAIPTGIHYDPAIDMFVFGNCLNQPFQREHLSYVLPVNQSDQPDAVRLPGHILLSWCNLLVRSVLPQDGNERTTERLQAFCREFGHLGVTLEYSDINRQKHRSQFRLRLLPRYIDMDGKRIICAFERVDADAPPAKSKMPGISVLFPGHTFRKVEI